MVLKIFFWCKWKMFCYKNRSFPYAILAFQWILPNPNFKIRLYKIWKQNAICPILSRTKRLRQIYIIISIGILFNSFYSRFSFSNFFFRRWFLFPSAQQNIIYNTHFNKVYAGTTESWTIKLSYSFLWIAVEHRISRYCFPCG